MFRIELNRSRLTEAGTNKLKNGVMSAGGARIGLNAKALVEFKSSQRQSADLGHSNIIIPNLHLVNIITIIHFFN